MILRPSGTEDLLSTRFTWSPQDANDTPAQSSSLNLCLIQELLLLSEMAALRAHDAEQISLGSCVEKGEMETITKCMHSAGGRCMFARLKIELARRTCSVVVI